MTRAHYCLLFGTILLAGCYSLNTLQNADSTAQIHVVPDKRVSWDRTMEGKLHLGQIIDTTVTGLRKLQVDVTNNYAYRLDFVYKVEWFDSVGMKVDPNDNWKRLRLEAHETSTISAIASSPQARDFIIKFQEASGNNTIF